MNCSFVNIYSFGEYSSIDSLISFEQGLPGSLLLFNCTVSNAYWRKGLIFSSSRDSALKYFLIVNIYTYKLVFDVSSDLPLLKPMLSITNIFISEYNRAFIVSTYENSNLLTFTNFFGDLSFRGLIAITCAIAGNFFYYSGKSSNYNFLFSLEDFKIYGVQAGCFLNTG